MADNLYTSFLFVLFYNLAYILSIIDYYLFVNT
nr:MAG TPA: hypothetical protein [Caudoviricetes sp.]